MAFLFVSSVRDGGGVDDGVNDGSGGGTEAPGGADVLVAGVDGGPVLWM